MAMPKMKLYINYSSEKRAKNVCSNIFWLCIMYIVIEAYDHT